MPDRAISPGHSELSGCPAFYFQKQLSPRELQTLELAAYGYTDNEIAMQLHVVVRTVRKYWQRARRKLKACNRTHAVAVAQALGWIKIDVVTAYEKACEEDPETTKEGPVERGETVGTIE